MEADLYDYRLMKVEAAVETLAEAVAELKEFAVAMKVHFKIGGALLLIAIGFVQPIVNHYIGG